VDSDEIRIVDTEEMLDEILLLPRVLLYKHSTRCGTSLRAMLEVERFARAEADVPVYGIDVLQQREISGMAAERLGIAHQSPQAILLLHGRPAWHASHSGITVAALSVAATETLSD